MKKLKQTLLQLALLLTAGSTQLAQAQTAGDEHATHAQHGAEVMDMEGMDHTQMDHSKMNHSGSAAVAQAQPSAEAMDMEGMDHSQMDHSSHESATAASQGQDATGLRDPHAYADGYGFGQMQHSMPGSAYLASLRVDRLEAVHSSDHDARAFDVMAWLGADYDRLAAKTEGEHQDGALHEMRSELLWWHAVASFWNTQLGMRHDSGEMASRNWLAAGIEGMAPYWFELDATAYVGEAGRTALRLNAEYELLFTQRLILQPRVEANWYGQADAERGQGAGLNNVTAGLRLRYEIRRELAPYVGVEWRGKFGEAADLALAAGARRSGSSMVAGVRFWF